MQSIYFVWLAEACGAGSAAGASLLAAFENDAQAVWRASDEAIDAVPGISARIKTALSDKDLTHAETILSRCRDLHIEVLCAGDAAYPKRLLRTPAYPIVLYYFGTLPNIDEEACIAVVGTRRMTSYGERMAYAVAYDLAKGGALVVSGMALGIDGVAQRAALDAGAHTIAVLGCGIDRVYPPGHRDLMTRIARHGTLISEYPPGTPPVGAHFPVRNRIISGLSLGALVVEADLKSGAMITANHARKQARDVFALPGKVGEMNSDGTLKLLASGAKMVTGGVDILEEYAYLYPQRITISNIPAFQPKRTISPIAPPTPAIGPTQAPELKEVPRAALPFSEEQSKTSVLRKVPVTKPRKQQEVRKPTAKPKRELPILSAAEEKIFSCFGEKPMTPDAIAAKSGEPVASVLLALTLLEIKGCVTAAPGGAYQSTFTNE